MQNSTHFYNDSVIKLYSMIFNQFNCVANTTDNMVCTDIHAFFCNIFFAKIPLIERERNLKHVKKNAFENH